MPGPDDTNGQAAQLLNDFQDIAFWKIALIVLAAWSVNALVRTVIPFLADRGPSQFRLVLLSSIPFVRLVTLSLAVLWILPIVFDITFQNFLVLFGAASVAIGFAFKDYVSSLIAGLVANFERPYRQGDWIRIGDDYGEVTSVGLRALVIRTPDDDMVTIPHSKLWTDNIANANDGARTLMCVADFYLDPRHDAARIRSVLQDVALTSAYLSYTNPVRVVLSETPLGTHYKLRAYPFDQRDQFNFTSDLTVRGKVAIAASGGREAVAAAAARNEGG